MKLDVYIRLPLVVWVGVSGLMLGIGALRVAAGDSGTSAGLSAPLLFQQTLTPAAEGRMYAVEPSDTLWTIAIKFYGNGTKYRLIQRANNLPDNARLRTGQILVIPPDSDTLPSPTVLPVTSSPTPTVVSPTPTVFPSPALSTPVLARPAAAENPEPSVSSDAPPASLVPLVSFIINMLIVICLIGSALCALLSYDLYRRARRYARRRYIGNRVRAGL